MPSKIIPLPPAAKIYPKQGIIQVYGRVHVHSLRILVTRASPGPRSCRTKREFVFGLRDACLRT